MYCTLSISTISNENLCKQKKKNRSIDIVFNWTYKETTFLYKIESDCRIKKNRPRKANRNEKLNKKMLYFGWAFKRAIASVSFPPPTYISYSFCLSFFPFFSVSICRVFDHVFFSPVSPHQLYIKFIFFFFVSCSNEADIDLGARTFQSNILLVLNGLFYGPYWMAHTNGSITFISLSYIKKIFSSNKTTVKLLTKICVEMIIIIM